jgi:methionine aminotransferase
MPGVFELRKLIASKIEKLYGKKHNVDHEITVTAGATQAIYTAITTLVQKGDEVIIVDPAYDSYVPGVKASGGIPVFSKLISPGFNYDWEDIRNKITRKTKLMILNSPHNPTGSLITKDDIKQLEKIVKDTNIFIISDEVYEHIVFDDEKHISFSSSDELSKRTFVISSFGKTLHTTGWKLGYCAAPDNLMKEFRRLHQFVVFSANTPIQCAYAEYLKDERHYLTLNQFYRKKRDIFKDNMTNSNFQFLPCKGTYFQLMDYSKISALNDFDFATKLTKEHGIAVIPLSSFYSEGSNDKVIRICFAKSDEVLIEAVEKLSRL